MKAPSGKQQAGGARRAALGVLLVGVAVAAGVALRADGLDGGGESGQLRVSSDRADAGAGDEVGAPANLDEMTGHRPGWGAWEDRADLPLEPRTGHSLVWTGEELLLWGGRDPERHKADGAAYDPETDRWRPIPEAPIRGRLSHAAVWTGQEMVIWGGRRTDNLGTLALDDGAAYDPATDTWRTLPPAPLGVRWSPAAVWTGSEVLLWGGQPQRLRGEPLADGAAYDPAADTWRETAEPPTRVRWGSVALWTGNELLAWGKISESADTAKGAAYDPAGDAWRELHTTPLGIGDSPGVWADDLAVFAVAGDIVSYDPAAGAWQLVAQVALTGRPQLAWAAGQVVVLEPQTGGGHVIDVRSGGVRGLPRWPGTFRLPSGTPTPRAYRYRDRLAGVPTGSRLLVVGGGEGEMTLHAWSPGSAAGDD